MFELYFSNELYKKETELCQLMTSFGSDKGNHHNYTTLYHFIFSNIRDSVSNFFEMGLGSKNQKIPSNVSSFNNSIPCGSLKAWRSYFKNSKIFGADIDSTILETHDRISTFYCDQTNPDSIKKLWSNIDDKIDIIVDDGYHNFNANITFLENSICQLRDGGFYIIEDIHKRNLEKFENYIKVKNFEYMNLVRLPTTIKDQVDNNLLIIKK